jgi:hypothetical protein
LTRRRTRKLYPSSDGRLVRYTPPTDAEKRRVANSASWRVGADVVSWIRQCALTIGCTQGELVRALLLAGRSAVDAGELEIENGRWRRKPDPNRASDPLGRVG